MALLDFIKDRQASQQQPAEKPQQQPPQTAKEMYAAQDAQEKANQKPLNPEAMAQADRVKETLDKSTFHIQSQSAPASPSEGGNSEPMRQNAKNQEKTAAPLSPTTEQVGKVAEKAGPETAKESPARNEQQRSQSRGGWER